MTTEIPVHYSSEDIQQLKLKIESKTWISRLKFVQRELEFYSFLFLSSSIVKKMGSTSSEIMERIPILVDQNENMTAKIREYRNQLDGIRECEDLQCDAFYLNDYEGLRVKMEEHIGNIQALKLTIFEELETVFH